MGLRSLTKRYSHFFIIFLLVLSQFIPIGHVSSASSISIENQSLSISPIDPEELFEERITLHISVDLVIHDDFVLALTTENFLFFLDITNPKKPIEIPIKFDLDYDSLLYRLTTYNKTLLLVSKNPVFGYSYSILKFNLDEAVSNGSEIGQFAGFPLKMKLTNDTLYALNWNPNDTFEFLIYNATNLDDLSLLGISTNLGFYFDLYYTNDLFVQEDFIYLIDNRGYLLIYQINSTYQLETIRVFKCLIILILEI